MKEKKAPALTLPNNAAAAHPDDQCHRHSSYDFHQGMRECPNPHPFEGDLEEPFILLSKSSLLILFHVEGLDDPVPVIVS